MATKFRPDKRRVVIRELGIPASVVDRFHGWVFVRSDAQPEHIGVLLDHEVDVPQLGPEQNPENGGIPGAIFWPLGIAVTLVSGFAAWYLLSLIPEQARPVILVTVFVAVLAVVGCMNFVRRGL